MYMKQHFPTWRMSILCLYVLTSARAAGPVSVPLPPPDTHGGKTLMTALKERASTKAYVEDSVSAETLSNLLWAAFGVNRPESGKRTAATAFNCRNIDIYVVFQEGTYVYDAVKHRLEGVSDRDLRSLAASQEGVRAAAVQLVYVADNEKIDDRFEAKKSFYAAFHAGSISQNVYLYCAASGLGSVVRDGVDRIALKQALGLRAHQHIVIAQTVGIAK